jgi:hypothetical protein
MLIVPAVEQDKPGPKAVVLAAQVAAGLTVNMNGLLDIGVS